MSEQVVIGVDAGGTSTRCLVAALDGRVRARARAGGANQRSSADPEAALGQAVGEALHLAGPVSVVGGVFGVSGAGAAGHGHAEDIALRAWKGLGLPGTPHVGDDITVAFAAGSAAGDGVVLISGTGAVAARLYGGEVVRRCDGYGWWLGDEGSAVWLATEGVRAALAALDGRGRPTVLVDLIAAALGVARGRPQAIIGAVYQIAPAELGRLAPEVSEAARAGDEVAAAITASAAERLLAGFAAVAPEIEPGPVVLSGAVLATGPVADLVREGLTRRFGITAVGAAPGEFGAAGLALRRNGQSILAHARLIDGVR